MINLTENEKQWILLCKGHFTKKYHPLKGNKNGWLGTFEGLFLDTFGWGEDCDRYGYLRGLFGRLFNIYSKIAHDQSGSNNELMGIFNAAFNKTISREEETPIERAICELRSLIANNRVIGDDGTKRYDLELKPKKD